MLRNIKRRIEALEKIAAETEECPETLLVLPDNQRKPGPLEYKPGDRVVILSGEEYDNWLKEKKFPERVASVIRKKWPGYLPY